MWKKQGCTGGGRLQVGHQQVANIWCMHDGVVSAITVGRAREKEIRRRAAEIQRRGEVGAACSGACWH